jgi:hypothetical protein
VLGVRPEGDGSFNGLIFYVKPKLFQLDRYSIAYSKFRYYPIKKYSMDETKPLKIKARDFFRNTIRTLKYNLRFRWRLKGGKA